MSSSKKMRPNLGKNDKHARSCSLQQRYRIMSYQDPRRKLGGHGPVRMNQWLSMPPLRSTDGHLPCLTTAVVTTLLLLYSLRGHDGAGSLELENAQVVVEVTHGEHGEPVEEHGLPRHLHKPINETSTARRRGATPPQ